MYYIYEETFSEMPRKPDPEMMPNDVKRIHVFNEYIFEKRFYFVSESEKMIYRYYIPEEYHPRPGQRSWDKLYPGCENGFVKEVYHRVKCKSAEFALIPDDDSKNRITLTLNEWNLKKLIE